MITIVQWRAAIGSFNPTRTKARSTHGIVISGRPIRTALRLILSLSLCIILSGDVETNPGPEFNKRPLENTEHSPNDTTEPKRIDQRISPEVVSHGLNPPVGASLVSAANEIHPLYTPGRPAVYLSLDSGTLTKTERPITRRCLSLDGETNTTAHTTVTTSHTTDTTSYVTDSTWHTITDTPSHIIPTHNEVAENTPKWVDKLILKIDDIRDRVCEIENVIQTVKETQDRVESLEKNVQSMKSQVNYELQINNEEVVKLQKQNKRQQDEIDQLRDQILIDQSRSMRSNLIFNGIAERQNEDTESLIRGFIHDKMGVNNRGIPIERAHRMGGWKQGKHRPIVVKFLNFKDKEAIRQAAPSKLKNTNFGVNEQFPREIAERRKLLLPIMKEERRNNRRAKLVVDRLHTDNATYVVKGDTVQKVINRGTHKQQSQPNTSYRQPAPTTSQGFPNSRLTYMSSSQQQHMKTANHQPADPVNKNASQPAHTTSHGIPNSTTTYMLPPQQQPIQTANQQHAHPVYSNASQSAHAASQGIPNSPLTYMIPPQQQRTQTANQQHAYPVNNHASQQHQPTHSNNKNNYSAANHHT